ncbi:TetR/AcrR family transcriptional regulator [Desulfotomaculum copahuensis]|uniref:HTH tetR-type domain-containing protein n=1 Tax=Desulfotomaculum copahuensis TaxID=1838280 RepID=A0A1B7LKM0_9FIRM|nr:TetR/AcrR family transcriptional regulator [Desulfotomaculum copahuensis]OAT87090.1 hypothetical protein A6M21_02025 [Desulfotomaculum copahuensis]
MSKEQSNKDKILAAAGDLFSQKGINNTSIGDLAEALGISKGTIYYYYKSKDDIIYDIVDRNFQQLTGALIERLHQLDRGIPPAEVVRLTLEAVVSAEELGRLTFHLIQEAITGNGEIRRKIAAKYREWRRLIADQLIDLLKFQTGPEELDAAAAVVLAFIEGITLQCLIAPEDIQTALVAEIFSKVLLK